MISKSIRFFLTASLVWLLTSSFTMSNNSFKSEQLQYPRVRAAYAEKGDLINTLLKDNQLEEGKFSLYLRAFKSEDVIEVWAKAENASKFSLIKTYAVCAKSGVLGPKRKEGDKQVPEGYYHINRFNPSSKFHLSLGINYPNASDKILADRNKPGDHIYIHGNCKTIGCLPITDDKIKELYLLCLEARNAGQSTIPVTFFPAKLSDATFEKLKETYKNDSDKINVWTDLKAGYDYFNIHKTLPSLALQKDGRYQVL